MSGTHTEDVPLPDGGDGLLRVTFTYRPGAPETPPAYDHGGLPADPPEIEVDQLARYCGEDGTVSVIPAFLASHERDHIAEYLLENWEPPSGPDPDDARDQRRDEERD